VHLSGAYWNLYLRQGDVRWKRRASQLDRLVLERFLENGQPRLGDRAAPGGFDVDLSVDREMPSPVGELLRIMSYHQADPDFINADRALRQWLHGEIARAPESHLAVLRQLAPPVAKSETMIALGQGRARLSRAGHGLNLLIDLEPGWHINADKVSDAQLVPTQVTAGEQVLSVQYPQSHVLDAAFSDRPIEVFDGEISIAITTEEAIEPQRVITVVLQACSDRVCLLPEKVELRAGRSSALN
jgi:hypothetical protein